MCVGGGEDRDRGIMSVVSQGLSSELGGTGKPWG